MKFGALLPAVIVSYAWGAWAQTLVTVRPESTDEVLANPGIGWETFHTTSKKDKALPVWIPSTVHYARYGWGELEPKPGHLNSAFLDKVLQDSHTSGQTLALRVMNCSTTKGQPYHPAWVKDIPGGEVQANYNLAGPFPVPDLDNPVVLERHLDFIKRLGERYDGHPDLARVDIGSVGWWGEWHMSGSKTVQLPTLENRKRIVDAYVAAFRKTPLIMLIGGGECLTYAIQHGAGWRADCLGDMGGFSRKWCHMRKGYPVWIREAGAREAWKTAPVAWESCWDMRKWVQEGWSLRFIFNYALALHGSCLNNKSAPLPQGETVRPEIERFLRRLGYRLVLCELKHPAEVRARGACDLAMIWQNVGSAPCYRPYRVAMRLSADTGYSKTFVSDIGVEHWLPGSIELFDEEFFKEPKDLPVGEPVAVTARILLPDDIPPGAYVLAIAIVDAATAGPVLQLGIQGRSGDGWYPLSRLTVAP